MKLDADLIAIAERTLARDGGNYALQDLIERVQDGRMQGFVRGRSWVVTQVLDFPRRRVLEVVLAVGDLEDVYALEADVEQFALEHGAKALLASGREGWDRRHSKGWRKVSHHYERVL